MLVPLSLQIHSHPSVIHLLLDNGADVNLLDDYGISALSACYHVLYAPMPEVLDATYAFVESS